MVALMTAGLAKLGAFVAAFVVPLAEGDLNLADAVTQALTIVTTVFSFMFTNPICVTLIALGLIPIGFHIFRSMKNAAGS